MEGCCKSSCAPDWLAPMQSLVKAWSALASWTFSCQSPTRSLAVASQNLRLCGHGLHFPPAPLRLLVVLHLSMSPLFSSFLPPASAWCQSQSHPMQRPCSSLSFFSTLGKPKVPLAPQAHSQVPDCPCYLDVFSSPHVFLGVGASFCMGSDTHHVVLGLYLACPSVCHGIIFNRQASGQSMGECWSMLKDITAISASSVMDRGILFQGPVIHGVGRSVFTAVSPTAYLCGTGQVT